MVDFEKVKWSKNVKYMNAEEVEKFKIQLQDDGYANTPQKYSNEVFRMVNNDKTIKYSVKKRVNFSSGDIIYEVKQFVLNVKRKHG